MAAALHEDIMTLSSFLLRPFAASLAAVLCLVSVTPAVATAQDSEAPAPAATAPSAGHAAPGAGATPADGSPRLAGASLKAVPYVTDETMRRIVQEAFADQIVITAPGTRRDGFSSAQRRMLDQRFEQARTPGCLRADGLKNQSTSIGPIGLGGLLALPMVAVAAVRGKCSF